jgi:hypothetical protein
MFKMLSFSEEIEFLPVHFGGRLTFTEIAIFVEGPMSYSHTDKKLILAVGILSKAVNDFMKEHSHEFIFHKPSIAIQPLSKKESSWDVKVHAKISWTEKKEEDALI